MSNPIIIASGGDVGGDLTPNEQAYWDQLTDRINFLAGSTVKFADGTTQAIPTLSLDQAASLPADQKALAHEFFAGQLAIATHNFGAAFVNANLVGQGPPVQTTYGQTSDGSFGVVARTPDTTDGVTQWLDTLNTDANADVTKASTFIAPPPPPPAPKKPPVPKVTYGIGSYTTTYYDPDTGLQVGDPVITYTGNATDGNAGTGNTGTGGPSTTPGSDGNGNVSGTTDPQGSAPGNGPGAVANAKGFLGLTNKEVIILVALAVGAWLVLGRGKHAAV